MRVEGKGLKRELGVRAAIATPLTRVKAAFAAHAVNTCCVEALLLYAAEHSLPAVAGTPNV
ncbi:MAG TPA: hypothetical protein VGM62_19825 [Chthoniobacterales bacterium]